MNSTNETREIKTAVILAAGQGTRMAPLTYATPKVLLPVGNLTALDILLMEIARAHLSSVFLVVDAEWFTVVERYWQKRGVELDQEGFSLELFIFGVDRKISQLSGSGGALLTLKNCLTGPFALLFSDNLLKFDQTNGVQDLARMSMSYMTTADDRPILSVNICSNQDISKYGCVTFRPNDPGEQLCRVTALQEKPRATEAKSNWALFGRMILPQTIFGWIEDFQQTRSIKSAETPLTGILAHQIENSIWAHVAQQDHFDIGSPNGYRAAFAALG